MPLARYFLFVGGALLALVFLADSFLPKLPVTEREETHLPAIHLHSSQKWPERIVYDTSIPTIIPPPQSAAANIPPRAAVADSSTKALKAFAQLQPSDQKKREPKPQRQRRIAKRNAAPPTLLVARQPQFGWFGSRIW
jgi:hypothetical protein